MNSNSSNSNDDDTGKAGRFWKRNEIYEGSHLGAGSARAKRVLRGGCFVWRAVAWFAVACNK